MKNAVVVGASGGIGSSLAKQLRSSGYDVANTEVATT